MALIVSGKRGGHGESFLLVLKLNVHPALVTNNFLALFISLMNIGPDSASGRASLLILLQTTKRGTFFVKWNKSTKTDACTSFISIGFDLKLSVLYLKD